MLYAAGLTIASAAMVGVLPALKATGTHVQAQVRNLGSRGSHAAIRQRLDDGNDRSGHADGHLSSPRDPGPREAVRDRMIRARFPAWQYLAVRAQLDRETASGV